MATFTDPAAFAKHIDNYSYVIERATLAGATAATKTAQGIVERHGRRYKIRGRSGGKFPLGAKSKPARRSGVSGVVYGEVDAFPVGFWKLVEEGAKPHWIGPRTYGRRAQRAAARKGQTLAAKGGIYASGYEHPVRGVLHPGTHGAIGHPWEEALAELKVVVPAIMKAEVDKALRAA